MFKLASFALFALAAVTVVNGAAIFPRQTPPTGWIAEILEPYSDYHTRYLAIGCREKHNTQFFDDCCHPLKKGETLEKNRKAYCRPGSGPAPSSTPASLAVHSSPAPSPTSVPEEGDNLEVGDNDNDDDEDEYCDDDYSSPAPAPTPSKTPEPTPSPKSTLTPGPAKPSSVKPSPTSNPKPSETPVNNPSSDVHSGGDGTWFTQNGNAGACGTVHSDNDLIAALDSRVYGDTSVKSQYCGQKIRVSYQGKSVDVIVADACPTCDNANSVDLSLAAFQALAPLDVGLLKDITWQTI